MIEFKENQSGEVVVTFRNPAGVLQIPAAATYRIDCLTTGQAVRAPTALTPASQVTITLTEVDNAILLASNQEERKLITVDATYGASGRITQDAEFSVKNLRGI